MKAHRMRLPALPSLFGKQGTGQGRKLAKTTMVALVGMLALQLTSSLFFLFKLLSDVLLWRAPFIPWEIQELLEVGASISLLLGVATSLVLTLRSARRMRRIEGQLSAASGHFQQHLDRQFAEWALTPTERQVAVMVVKGFSNAEIARFRKTTESTIKSQLSSVFRKAQLNTRQQLVSCVIEDLVSAL